MNNDDNLLGIIKSIFRWKKHILILCLLAGIGAVVISLLLPNYYKATTVFYAASEDVIKPDPVGNALKERAYYGRDEDIDKILTIAQSSELKSYLVNQFNLFDHYEIDSTAEKAKFKIVEKLDGLYDIIKTKYEAIELSIEDKDPALAGKMANAARDKINELSKKLTKEAQRKQLLDKGKTLKTKEEEINAINDSLTILKQRYGIYNVISQSESLSKQLSKTEGDYILNKSKMEAYINNPSIPRDTIAYIKATVHALEQKLKAEKSIMDKFNMGSPEVSKMDNTVDIAIEQLAEDKERYKQLKAAFEADTPMLILVEAAETPLIKSRPKRSILCMATVLLTLIFSMLAAIIIDTYKDVNWKAVFNDE